MSKMNPAKSAIRLAALWITLLVEPAMALTTNKSQSKFTVNASGIEGEITFHWQDLSHYFVLDGNGNGTLEASELSEWRVGLKALCETFFTLWIGSTQYQLATTDLQFDPARNLLVFQSQWEFPDHAEPLEAFDIAFIAMEDMAASHAHHLTVVDTTDQILFHEVFSQTPGNGKARPGLHSESAVSSQANTVTAATKSESRSSILWLVVVMLLIFAAGVGLLKTRNTA